MNHEYKYKKMIVFEGVDGAGKTTQINMLEQYLRDNNRKVVKIHCPDYSYYTGMLIKDILQGRISDNPDDINLYAFSAMYAIDRYMVVNSIYREYFYNEDNDHDYYILMDRYTQSNLIHQGAKLIKSIDNAFNHDKDIWETTEMLLRHYGKWLYRLEYDEMKLPRPDKVLYLSIPPDISRDRVLYRGNPDIHESESYIARSAISGNFYANYYKWDIIDCYDIEHNTQKSILEVHREILDVLRRDDIL